MVTLLIKDNYESLNVDILGKGEGGVQLIKCVLHVYIPTQSLRKMWFSLVSVPWGHNTSQERKKKVLCWCVSVTLGGNLRWEMSSDVRV